MDTMNDALCVRSGSDEAIRAGRILVVVDDEDRGQRGRLHNRSEKSREIINHGGTGSRPDLHCLTAERLRLLRSMMSPTNPAMFGSTRRHIQPNIDRMRSPARRHTGIRPRRL